MSMEKNTTDLAESLENKSEQIPVQVTYELSDSYGGNVTKETSDSFELNIARTNAPMFDGYIHTPEGDFAFQGRVEEAKQVLKHIKEFCETSANLKEIQGELKKARASEQAAIASWRDFGKSSKLVEDAKAKVWGLSQQEYKTQWRLSAAEGKVKAYR